MFMKARGLIVVFLMVVYMADARDRTGYDREHLRDVHG